MRVRDYCYIKLFDAVSLAHGASAAYSNIVDIHDYTELLLTYNATIALTGGSSPGIKFTLELDVSGAGEWVLATTLITTLNGFTAAATADPTVTSTGKSYNFYPQVPGMRARVKYEVTGAPTGGTATITGYLLGKSRG